MEKATESTSPGGRRRISRGRKALYLLIVYSVFFMLYEGGLRLFAVRESWDRSLGWTPCGAARSRGTRAGPGLAA